MSYTYTRDYGEELDKIRSDIDNRLARHCRIGKVTPKARTAPLVARQPAPYVTRQPYPHQTTTVWPAYSVWDTPRPAIMDHPRNCQ